MVADRFLRERNWRPELCSIEASLVKRSKGLIAHRMHRSALNAIRSVTSEVATISRDTDKQVEAKPD